MFIRIWIFPVQIFKETPVRFASSFVPPNFPLDIYEYSPIATNGTSLQWDVRGTSVHIFKERITGIRGI